MKGKFLNYWKKIQNTSVTWSREEFFKMREKVELWRRDKYSLVKI